MGLTQSNIQRIAAFVRKVTKAPNAETIVAETFQVLRQIAKINRLRIVYSLFPGRWTEWNAASNGLEIRPHDTWPAPDKKTPTAFFDTETQHSGFISAGGEGEQLLSVLDVLAPEVWSALLLRSAVDRVQKASSSEAELARATLRARDEERRHIACELHDDLGQSLASLKLGLKWAEDHIRNKQDAGNIIEELSKAREDVGV